MSKSIFFKGLSELRAIAALAVLFHHLELFRYSDDYPALLATPWGPFTFHIGKNGVYLFFVLSGFLITYLLLVEKSKRGLINIPKFYIRRALRIWPLYYLIIAISFLIVPLLPSLIPSLSADHAWTNMVMQLRGDWLVPLVLFLLFLPNLALQFRPPVVGASQAWSVGVEEQFYLVWPHVINRVKNSYLPFVFVFIIISLPVFKHIRTGNGYEYIVLFKQFLTMFVIELMAVGALAAYLFYYYKEAVEKVFTSQLLYLANLAIVAVLLFQPYNYLLLGFFFATLILFVIQEDSRLRFKLRNRYLDRLGVLSYGIYMIHPLMMYLTYAFFEGTGLLEMGTLAYSICFNILVTVLTITVSHLSYTYYESWFLRLKDRKYTIINSGRAAENGVPMHVGQSDEVPEEEGEPEVLKVS